jgi:hypothetical protein
MDGTLNPLSQLFQLANEFEQTMHTNFLTPIVPGVIGTEKALTYIIVQRMTGR